MSSYSTIGCLLAGFAALAFPVSPANAGYGPRTVIGEFYQQTTDVMSPDGVNPGSCGHIACHILFEPVPNQQKMVIDHVSCHITIGNGDLRLVQLLSRKKDGTFPVRHTMLSGVRTEIGRFVVSETVQHAIDRNERPLIILSISSQGFGPSICNISGRILPP